MMSIALSTGLASLRRVGVVMRPEPKNSNEIEGVLNPGACRDRYGRLLLFPRVVAAGNYSRIAIAEVVFDHKDVPISVKRLGYALEPQEAYEKHVRSDGRPGGGVEDPRVTYVAALDLYVMTYVAFGPAGPRNALAVSDDAYSWRRLGLVAYDASVYHGATDINFVDNKDAVFFDQPVLDPNGIESIAILHRPGFAPGTAGVPRLPSIWISYVPLAAARKNPSNLLKWSGHRVVAEPQTSWEVLKIGAGPAPILTKDGWYLMHHGVSGKLRPGEALQQELCYCPGSILLDLDDPGKVRTRSQAPLLRPMTKDERSGAVANVIFPTAIDGDWVFYGMGDSAIGVAKLTLS